MSYRYKPVDHAAIPDGTLVYKEVVLSMWPGSIPTLWRLIGTGEFPPPRTHVGRRPAWLIDDIRAVCRGEWRQEGNKAGAWVAA